MAHDTQTLPVITIDDYERDDCQFTYFGTANNANLSCSSKDSSVGKPRTVGEDNRWLCNASTLLYDSDIFRTG